MTDRGWTNKLYFGDKLTILRDHIESESVDLIYLDRPFDSKATHNALFKEQNGTQSHGTDTAHRRDGEQVSWRNGQRIVRPRSRRSR